MLCKPVRVPIKNGDVECTDKNRLESVCVYSCDEFYGLVDERMMTVECVQEPTVYDTRGEWQFEYDPDDLNCGVAVGGALPAKITTSLFNNTVMLPSSYREATPRCARECYVFF